jgi:periplasmic protein TonB
MHDSITSGNQTDNLPPEGIGDTMPGAPDGLIPLGDSRPRPLPPNNTDHHVARPQVVHMTSLDPAMLIHRVEPVYPALARQVHREGRVEMRAIIGTDGTIQSLQIVAGDPLFQLSAREAVEQWRYKPTILNGQPVEIDTYITVIYTMQR